MQCSDRDRLMLLLLLFFFLNAPGQRYYSHDKSWKLDAFNACMTFFLYNSLDEEHSVLSDAESIQ
jgi:hypothetical protein